MNSSSKFDNHIAVCDNFIVMLAIDLIISHITPWLFPLSILILVVSIVADIMKKKFYWSKIALIILIVTIVLLVIEMALTYNVTRNVINGS
jgi:uncharacterized membrane protein